VSERAQLSCDLGDQVIGRYDAYQHAMCRCDRAAPDASGAHASEGLFHRVILTKHQWITGHDLIAEYLGKIACTVKLRASDVAISDHTDRHRLIHGRLDHYYRADVAFAHEPGDLGKGRRRGHGDQIPTAQLSDIHGRYPGGEYRLDATTVAGTAAMRISPDASVGKRRYSCIRAEGKS
jgi:hypothetical protein